MSTSPVFDAEALSSGDSGALGTYSAEFRKLVDRYTPSQCSTPSSWLRRLPEEVFQYYWNGISTFGADARTPMERRGRLYLMHTALLFMWMSWGKEAARRRFPAHARTGTRRAASLVTLDIDRRAGVLAQYETDDWFSQPVGEWSVTLISGIVDLDRVADDALREVLRAETVVTCNAATLSELRAEGAVPNRTSLRPDFSVGESPEPADLFPFLEDVAGSSEDSSTGSSSRLVQASFYDDALGERLRNASDEALHQAAFGIIRLDERGIVTFYNRFEQRFAERSAEATLGRSFFDEVAPCTRSRFFWGRFKKGLEEGRLDTTFTYTLTYRMRPTLVDVRMLVARPGEAWILIRPKARAAA
jgi:photoactive yellow protein